MSKDRTSFNPAFLKGGDLKVSLAGSLSGGLAACCDVIDKLTDDDLHNIVGRWCGLCRRQLQMGDEALARWCAGLLRHLLGMLAQDPDPRPQQVAKRLAQHPLLQIPDSNPFEGQWRPR